MRERPATQQWTIPSTTGAGRPSRRRSWPSRHCRAPLTAAKGALPGQGSRFIRFAYAPKYLEPHSGDKPIGWCGGYTPAGCGDEGYASSDIFYMEACVYSMMCKNRDQLWSVEAEEVFMCDMDWEGYKELRDALLPEGAVERRH